MKKTPDSLGKRLRKLRADYGDDGLSQFATCLAAGITQTRYWRIEKNLAIPRPAELRALARVLRTTVAHLTGVDA